MDCNGLPNGVATVDECGVCGGDGSSCSDCTGVPHGKAAIDCWGECEGDGEGCCDNDSDCVKDCMEGLCTENGQCEFTPGAEICDDGIDNDCDPATFCYVARAGGVTSAIRPIVGQTDPVTFYDYYNASAHTGFELKDRASVMLYQDASGNVHVSYVLDQVEDGSGGSYDVNYTGPEGLVLVVADDTGEPTSRNWEIDPAGGTGFLSFKWNSCCTDGFVIGNFPADGCVDFRLSNVLGIDGISIWRDETSTIDLGQTDNFQLCGVQ